MSSDGPRTVHPLIKVLFGIHVVVITLWCFPMAPRSFRILADPNATPREKANAPQPSGVDAILFNNDRYVRENPVVRGYLLSSGLWQYWDMFAPNPSKSDYYIDMVVRYRDGSESTFDYPRMETMGILAKYTHERYRKFMERGHADDYAMIRPYISRHVARLMNVDPSNPPVVVRLRRHWRMLPGPDKPMPPRTTTEFFEYNVLPEDLK
jgi:hypothetical protein